MLPEQFSIEQLGAKEFVFLFALLRDGDLMNYMPSSTRPRYIAKLDQLVEPLQPDEVCFGVCVSYLMSLLVMVDE